MILSAQSIRRRGLVTPCVDRTVVDGMTFGLSAAGYDVRVAEKIMLMPGQFLLASTVERFRMGDDVLGVVHDKSTWARRGVTVQNTVIEPGWRGYLTIELTNHSPEIVVMERCTPIAQVVFHLLDQPTSQPYAGKYQDQKPGPQPARFERQA